MNGTVGSAAATSAATYQTESGNSNSHRHHRQQRRRTSGRVDRIQPLSVISTTSHYNEFGLYFPPPPPPYSSRLAAETVNPSGQPYPIDPPPSYSASCLQQQPSPTTASSGCPTDENLRPDNRLFVVAQLVPIRQTYTRQILASCVAFWLCGCLIAAVAFIIAVLARYKASDGKLSQAQQLGRISMGLSYLSISVGLIIWVFVIWYCTTS